MSIARLISGAGVSWAGQLAGQPDLLIYCSDGILTGSQVIQTFLMFMLMFMFLVRNQIMLIWIRYVDMDQRIRI